MIERFQILSLDGGGIKGLFSAAVLAHIEEDCGINIVDHFDLITGTSTGGIIALGLGMGMRPIDIVKFYVDKGPAIFPQGNWIERCWRWTRGWICNKYENDALKRSLQECFGERLLGESRKRLVIPSYNLGEDDVYLFKTPYHQRLRRDFKVPTWKVALATSAAPTFFPAYKEVDHVRLIDGGVWANNPTLVGIAEAVSMLDVPLGAIRVLSLGTTDEVKGRRAKLDAGGLWQWKKDAVDVIMRGQSIGAYTQALHLLGRDRVVRIDPKVPDRFFKLDKLSAKELLAKAAHESRISCPVIHEKFLEHYAEISFPYHPFNQ
jgi:patatin-like phospholipase/acyl hydrolase